ncbi:MAG: hypothetical protein CO042_02420 [Parcubacteria group bacterium CG_4_9_14_0_2_um_filter_41_8]|nr:MAG: hypothetical protein CO042_02420 [Parcubacteria group bacterium CG_4_9_14_0_2_um_filter_41_8]
MLFFSYSTILTVNRGFDNIISSFHRRRRYATDDTYNFDGIIRLPYGERTHIMQGKEYSAIGEYMQHIIFFIIPIAILIILAIGMTVGSDLYNILKRRAR